MKKKSAFFNLHLLTDIYFDIASGPSVQKSKRTFKKKRKCTPLSKLLYYEAASTICC